MDGDVFDVTELAAEIPRDVGDDVADDVAIVFGDQKSGFVEKPSKASYGQGCENDAFSMCTTARRSARSAGRIDTFPSSPAETRIVTRRDWISSTKSNRVDRETEILLTDGDTTCYRLVPILLRAVVRSSEIGTAIRMIADRSFTVLRSAGTSP